MRIAYEELANKRVARVLPSGREALQDEGAQISKRGAPKYHGRLPGGAAQIFASTLHVEILRQCGHHPPLSTLSLPLPTAQIHCGHNSLPKLLLKLCGAISHSTQHTHMVHWHTIHKPLSGSKVKEQDYLRYGISTSEALRFGRMDGWLS